MADIELYDGTRDPNYGKVLGMALKELAAFQRVSCRPLPGTIDVPGYEFVRNLEEISFCAERNQVCLNDFLQLVENVPGVGDDIYSQKVFLIESDCYSEGINWCFGGYMPRNGVQHVIISLARVQDEFHLFDICCHEFGHMYGAAIEGRSNTVESLGTHCINDLCVMQQKLSVPESLSYVRERHRLHAPTYCEQCADELTR